LLEVRPSPDRNALQLAVSPELLPVLMPLVVRVRRMFDLDARPDLIAAVLGADKTLGPMVAARPGLRVPGAIDPFEASVRALLGQQISVAAATTLAGRFAAELGAPYRSAHEIANVDVERIARLGMPGKRAHAIRTFAAAVAAGRVRLDVACDLDRFVA